MTLALRSASVNRLVRSRLLTSGLLFSAYAVGAALAAYAPLPPDVAVQIRAFIPLLLALGIATLVVVASTRGARIGCPIASRTSSRTRSSSGCSRVVAMLVMQEKLLATTAVGAVVVGFALQDTLGNLFAGLAIQIEKPFRVGHWVTIGGIDGLVTEVTWRATKIRTKAGNFVVVPNSVVAKETITNYSEPTRDTRVEVEVGASYDTPAERGEGGHRRAASRRSAASRADREPEVLVADFAASAITYRMRVWSDRLRGRRRPCGITCARASTTRSGGTTSRSRNPCRCSSGRRRSRRAERGGRERAPENDDIFAALTDEQRAELVGGARPVLFAPARAIVREGERGTRCSSCARRGAVTLAGADGELARLRAGDFFGEMSLLTGEPRTARR